MGAFNFKTWINNVDATNATNLQRYDDWIRQAEGSTPGPPSVSGQTSGTATLYQILHGTVKKFVVIFTNYRNNANQYLTLPTAFTTRGWFNIGDTGGGHIAFYTGGSGGSTVSCNLITSFASGGGGIAGPQSFTAYYSIGQINAGFDTIQLQTNSSAASGIMTVEGV
jgi:hypothetical protein